MNKNEAFNFDIGKYRNLPKNYSERIKYVNMICSGVKGEKLVSELKFIRIQIDRFCRLKVYESGMPTGEEQMYRPDLLVLVEVNKRLKYEEDILGLKPVKEPKPSPHAFGPEYQEPTTKLWALFYWYKREVGLHPELHSTGNKKKNMEELAKKHKVSSQNFFQTFNAIGRNSEKNPKRNPKNIELVIPLLADFPEAQQLAKDELGQNK